MPQRELFLLGGFRAALDGTPVAGLTSPKLQGLLAYLALAAPAPVPREQLAALLWPDNPEARASHSLRQAIYRLNKILACPDLPDPLDATRQTVVLHSAAFWSDAVTFLAALEETGGHAHAERARCATCCTRLAQAIPLYGGALLEGVTVGSEPFEEWLWPWRRQLERLLLAGSGDLIGYYQARGEHGEAEQYALRQVALAPWYEPGHRQLLQALAAQGRRTEALARAQQMVDLLRATLDVAPAPATEALVASIRAGTLAPARPARPRYRLPPQHTPFVGRARELARIGRRLADPTCHLLSLVGPGGAGKTRLAVQAAEAHGADFRDGAVFVPLAATAPANLATAILAALAIPISRGEEGSARAQLLEILRRREMLLILDNYEHLLPERGLIVQILQEAADVQLLVTSRHRLALRAEWVLDVAGLPYPAPGEEALGSQFEAIALFEALARRLQPEAEVGGKREIAALCRLVAGLPLALELASAAVRERPLSAIVKAVADNLDFLATAMPDAEPRHRSLRAVFDHSWALLDAVEQEALCRLAVFQGGFTAAAAARVAGAPPAILEALGAKSLLQEEGGRYRLHAVLRQYAAERLAARPETAAATAQAHGDYYLDLVRAMEGVPPGEARLVIGADLDNVRAAWQQAARAPAPGALARVLPGLVRFYVQASYLEEGEAMLAAAAAGLQGEGTPLPQETGLYARLRAEQLYFSYGLARYDETLAAAQVVKRLGAAAGEAAAVARAHFYTGAALARRGDYAEAGEAIDTARELAEEAGASRLVADCLRLTGQIAVRLGDYATGERAYTESLAISRQERYPRGEAHALGGLGNTALVQEQPLLARTRYEAALAQFAAAGEEIGAATARDNLGTSYWAVGDFNRAAAIHVENLAVRRRIGDRRGEGASLLRLAIQRHYRGELGAGREHYQEALAIFQEIGYRRGEGEVLAHLCLLAHQEGAQPEAIALGRQAEAIARANHDRSDLAYALTFLGHALAAAGEGRAARAAYAEALALRRDLGEWNRTLEPLAGLAELALAAGDLARAQAHAGQIQAHLDSGTLDLVDQPARVYLAAVRVLEATGDRRAGVVLARGQAFLRERAALLAEGAGRYLALPGPAALSQL